MDVVLDIHTTEARFMFQWRTKLTEYFFTECRKFCWFTMNLLFWNINSFVKLIQDKRKRLKFLSWNTS